MSSQLQNRLVGTVILVALAVIILPDLLDGDRAPRQAEFQTIPLEPEADVPMAEVVMPEVERVSSTDSTHEDEVTADEAPTVTENEATEVAAKLPEPREAVMSDSSYVIQLGVFRNADSVNRLVEQLQQENYRAYAVPVTDDAGQQLNRVMVGPDVSQAKLEQQLDELHKLTGLQGKVITYRPASEN